LIGSNNWVAARGFQKGGTERSRVIEKVPFVPATMIQRYSVPGEERLFPPYVGGCSRIGDEMVYQGPHLLFKEATVGGRLWAAFTHNDCAFLDTVTGVHAPVGNEPVLKAMVCYMTSSVASYFLFMTTGWGIDRKRVKKGEVLSLPSLPIRNADTVQALSSLHDEMTGCTNGTQTQAIQNRIDEVICQSFRLTSSERVLIRDMANTGIDYAHKFVRSKSIAPPTKSVLLAYANSFNAVLGRMLKTDGKGISAVMYGGKSPLRVASFTITDSTTDGFTVGYEESAELDALLQSLEGKLWQKGGVNLFRRRHAKIYEGRTVYIVKPAEARFWTQSVGYHDADETIASTIAGGSGGVSGSTLRATSPC
jgi:hypothetical protein